MTFQSPVQSFVVAFPQVRKKSRANIHFVRERAPCSVHRQGGGQVRTAASPKKTRCKYCCGTFRWTALCLYFPHPDTPSCQARVLFYQLFLKIPVTLAHTNLSPQRQSLCTLHQQQSTEVTLYIQVTLNDVRKSDRTMSLLQILLYSFTFSAT